MERYHCERLGELTLLRHKQTGELLALKQTQTTSESEDKKLMNQLESCQEYNHINVVKIRKIERIKENYLCSSMQKINVYFDIYKTTLGDDI